MMSNETTKGLRQLELSDEELEGEETGKPVLEHLDISVNGALVDSHTERDSCALRNPW